MDEKLDTSYKFEPMGEEANTLYDNGKVREVFLLAEAGAIATIEELSGQVYVVMKKEKLDEILKQFADKQDVKIEYSNSGE